MRITQTVRVEKKNKMKDDSDRPAAETSNDSGSRGRLNTWQSIQAVVLTRIRSGEWRPGELIPTEHDLAQELGCARATVNRALRELADEGIVERRRKVGTRVKSAPANRARIDMPLIRHEIERAGAQMGYRLTSTGMRPATAQISRLLQLDTEIEVLVTASMFTADRRPYCYELRHTNLALIPELDPAQLRETSADELVARHLPTIAGRFSIKAESADGDCAQALRVSVGSPVLAIDRTCWLDARPISYSRVFYPSSHRLFSVA